MGLAEPIDKRFYYQNSDGSYVTDAKIVGFVRDIHWVSIHELLLLAYG